MGPTDSRYASKAYTRVAREILDPRELEAALLLKSAAKLQTALDGWDQKPPPMLSDAVLYTAEHARRPFTLPGRTMGHRLP